MRIIFAAILLAAALAGNAAAQRREFDPSPHLQTVPGPTEASTRCTLAEVATYDTRVHVKCELYQTYREGNGGGERRIQAYRNEIDEHIVYYAVAADNPLADRVVALAVEANPGDEVTIFFRINAADNPTGCNANDCRRLTGLVLPIRH